MSIPTRFVLIETSHAGNVGAVARALRVMGFDDLVLVQPRWPNVLRREETIQRASGALDVLQKARIVDSLQEALEGMSLVCATAMVPRDFGPPTWTPRAWMTQWTQTQAQTQTQTQTQTSDAGDIDRVPAPPTHYPVQAVHQGVAFLFGSERYGMRNEDIYRSHVVLTIPTDPTFGSLNLAAAVQLIAYEWRMALGAFVVKPATAPTVLADASEVAGLLKHWEEALIHLQFLDPLAPKKLMPRLNQLLNRAQLTQEEIHLLRGVAKHVLQSTPAHRG